MSSSPGGGDRRPHPPGGPFCSEWNRTPSIQAHAPKLRSDIERSRSLDVVEAGLPKRFQR